VNRVKDEPGTPSQANKAKAPAGNPISIDSGTFIALGAGLGVIAGILSGNLVLGLLIGAGIGTVAGAARSTVKPPRAP
jgi:hypothetical protein